MNQGAFFDWLQENKGLSLNAQQKEAICAPPGASLILATPGSGKTTVMVARIAYMHLCEGISLSAILPATFSRAGACDMRRRYASLFGKEAAPRFSTLHAFCGQVLRAYGSRYGRNVFDLLPDSPRVLRGILAQQGVRYLSEDLLQSVSSAVGYAKNRMLTPEQIEKMEVEDCDFPAVFSQYERYKRENRLMDYDDMLLYALAALQRNGDLLAHFRALYPHLMVDEAQDTSPVQHKLIHLLAGDAPSLFMVGDEDQCIYGFRGADPNALLQFEQDYPGGRVYTMETNYRSGGRIVDLASRFIAQNSFRRQKSMRPGTDRQAIVERVTLADWREQAAYVVRRARELGDGRTLGVLYRNNDSAPAVASALMAARIPFALDKSELRLLTHHTLRNLRSLYALSLDPLDREAFFDVHKRIVSNLPAPLLSHIRRHPERNPFVEIYNLAPLSEREKQGLEHKVDAICGYKKMPPYEALLDMASRFYIGSSGPSCQKVDALLSMARGAKTFEELLAHLEEVNQYMKDGPGNGAHIFLTTIHGAKGLEYDEVILLDAMDEILPASNLRNTPEERARYEEEVRLFYVAITRARERVTLPVAQKSHGRQADISAFVSLLLAPPPLARTPHTMTSRPSPVRKSPLTIRYADWEGAMISHKTFGAGRVVRVQPQDELLVAMFPDGKKTIHLPTCLARHLIKKE